MKLPYPQSKNCSFSGFPSALEVRLGDLASSEITGCTMGSKRKLFQTPKSGVPQGSYVEGESLPDCRIIYTDTGSDDEFTMKVSFFGYYTYYKRFSSDTYLRLFSYKAIAIETNILSEVIFPDSFDCETNIAAGSGDTTQFTYSGSSSIRFWYNGTEHVLSDGSYVVLDGTIYSCSGGTLVIN